MRWWFTVVVGLAWACAAQDGPGSDRADTEDGSPSDDTETPVVGDPGLLLHRLDGSAWQHSVRDLLYLGHLPDVALPVDPSFGVFDHTIEGLTLTDYHLELYDLAVDRVLEPLASPDHAAWSKLVACDVAEADCREASVGAFASRAWRRPLRDEEQDRLAAFVEAGIADDGLEPHLALLDGLHAVLMSPNFLFRIEERGVTGEEPVDAWELAARLAFFLWKSVPDEALRADAASGDLLRPEVRLEHARRMLADPRAEALVDGFAGQWLEIRAVDHVRPESQFFPPFDLPARDRLRASMKAEMTWKFSEALTGDEPVASLFGGTTSLVDANLAPVYDMTAPSEPTVLALPEPRGAGWLTTAGWLMVTSKVSRTTPTRRGKWISERLLCSPPVSPPANLDVVNGSDARFEVDTIRAAIEALTDDPYCQTCHARIDPYGFALEQFSHDARWGLWQDGGIVDVDVKLPDGTRLSGANELAAAVRSSPALQPCFVKFASSYALGRTPPEDVVDAIFAEVAPEGAPIATTFERIAASDWFARRAPALEAP